MITVNGNRNVYQIPVKEYRQQKDVIYGFRRQNSKNNIFYYFAPKNNSNDVNIDSALLTSETISGVISKQVDLSKVLAIVFNTTSIGDAENRLEISSGGTPLFKWSVDAYQKIQVMSYASKVLTSELQESFIKPSQTVIFWRHSANSDIWYYANRFRDINTDGWAYYYSNAINDIAYSILQKTDDSIQWPLINGVYIGPYSIRIPRGLLNNVLLTSTNAYFSTKLIKEV